MPDEFSAADKLKEIEREIEYRRFVYRKAVKAGKMKVDLAARRIRLMQSIAEDYRRALAPEPDLFQRSIVDDAGTDKRSDGRAA